MGRGYDLEEIYQIGCIGMLNAIDRFDEGYEVMFSTYAVPLITGQIKRFLRDNGAIKVSRVLKQNGYIISKARTEFLSENEREPTMEELSLITGLSKEDMVEALDANREVESLYQSVEGKNGSEMLLLDRVEDSVQGQFASDAGLERLMVQMAIDRLDDTGRSIIIMRYFEGKTQTETARILGISQVQVSRIEKKTLKVLREIIGKSNL
jgi:RNA polymerase sporulation-specific sigma factor